ncbi:LysR family transcriptional regulator [Xylophilus ampelinus]|uniref:DNA-binding transcriptional LysR family regulator n=1 Tax=Xylophilus ampelinus TaxID=54067 RepID=A0A318SJF3_9BURK|nr:LysR family transcriptional regulator [Xylophilus ampelinus]MCS4509404.1 LysR family transcriptional regulator [Xylophilus ampelinus]PYE79126.1 DNA-binding transcriptional LysR family regulator [Xylophilus ampelinus]
MPFTDAVPRLLNRMRMRQVALVLAIEERSTLRAAASELGMTQPAATKMLHELEDTLGYRLFDRVGRGLRVNAAGACVTEYFRGMRGGLEALRRELQGLRLGSAGKLFIGSIMAASPADLTLALVRLKALYPLLSVEISVGTSDRLMEQLREGRLDVVIGRMPGGTGGDCVFEPLSDERLSVVVAVSHPLARARTVTFAALQAYPWILQPAGSPMREAMEQEFAAHHLPLPPGLVETASILTTTDLIARTDMVAVIPWSIAGRYAEHGLLRVLPCPIRNRLAAYGSIVRSDRPASAALRHFVELLHAPAAAVDAPAAPAAALPKKKGLQRKPFADQ